MIYTFILLMIFILFLLIKKPGNKGYLWIVISIIGFCVAIFAFIFYIFYLYEYFKIETAYSDFSSSVWLFLNFLRLKPFYVNRLLNLGVVTFVFSFLNFSYVYAFSYSDNIKKYAGWKFLMLPLLFLIVYDPAVLRFLFTFAMDFKQRYFNFSFTSILNVLNWFNKAWLLSYLLLGFYWLYTDYRRHMIQRIKKKILYVILCLIPISGLCLMMFYWFPQQIIVLRESSLFESYDSQYTYLEFSYGNFIHLPVLNKLYPLIAIISMLILVYAIYSLKAFSIFEKIQYDKLDYSLTTAGMGAKLFSHAFKNDLYAIKLLVQDNMKNGNGTEALQRILKICDFNLERLDGLRKVLNINIAKLVPADVKACVQQGIEKVDIPENIRLVADFEDGIMEAYMDVDYFSEVIGSILVNSIDAINYQNKEGIIQVSVYTRYMEIIITIKDNGCGISPEKAERIFDPFYSTKPSTKNWGMGLSYCNKVVQMHNGEIHFNTSLNNGSEVLIYLPSVKINPSAEFSGVTKLTGIGIGKAQT